jgi:hypothetical protein
MRLIIAGALLMGSGCRIGSGSLAGTSTSVGDTANGLAVLSDGSGAAGALVVARLGDIEFRDGKPQGVLLDSTRADSRGHFRLPSLASGASGDSGVSGNAHLEIVCDSTAACGKEKVEVYFGRIRNASGLVGEFKLSPPGSLLGTVHWGDAPDSAIWVGFQGSARFAQARKLRKADGEFEGRFFIDGVYPGAYPLFIFGGVPSNARIQPIRIQAGAVTNITITLD